MSRLLPPPFGTYNIVCPHCKVQNLHMLEGDYTDVQCPLCNGYFRILIATVRAKRGRANGRAREYVIRTITRSGEGVLRFVDYGGSDLDVRSRDIVYICYKMNEANGAYDSYPSILCNLTTHKYTDVRQPKPIKTGCFIATVTCGYASREVETLSNFRDNVLSRNRIGILFVRFYYRVSPYLAFYVFEKRTLKRGIRRFFVSPTVLWISRIFKLEK